MDNTSDPHAEIDRQKQYLKFAWLVWGLAVAYYFFDYLARVSPGVMHQYLQIEFDLNEAQFGILTASFYVPYVFMQIPVGLIVDRISIRWLLTTMSLLTAFGCCVFGLANGLMTASIGRMLIGFSAAFAFVCSLRLATSWFPPTMLGLLSGLTQALGMLGAAAGQAPVSFLLSNVTWRHSMLIIAFLFIALSGLLYQFIQDKPGERRYELRSMNRMNVLDSLAIVLSSPQTWLNALYTGFLFAPTAVIGEAFGPDYLQFGRGFGAHTAAFAVGLIFIGWGISGPLSGWLSDRVGRRKPFMILSALFGILFTTLIVYSPHLSVFTTYLLFFAFGATNTGVAIGYAVSTEIHDRKVVGTSIAFTNMASIFVGALLQPLVGALVDMVSGARAYNVESLLLSDFQAGLKLLPISSFIALILALAVKETYCQPVRNK